MCNYQPDPAAEVSAPQSLEALPVVDVLGLPSVAEDEGCGAGDDALEVWGAAEDAGGAEEGPLETGDGELAAFTWAGGAAGEAALLDEAALELDGTEEGLDGCSGADGADEPVHEGEAGVALS